ncbi:MAG: M23 family metallopeptidase [Clostridia bacterium]|nr:M23 family metallopeptidase [Clostridia bacterium]
MRKSSGKDKFKWIQTKAFYGVVMSLLLAITGIGSAIYNVAKVRDMLPDNQGDEPATIFSIPETTEKNTQSQANANVTNVPDDREQSLTTLNDLNRPYSGYYMLPLNSKVQKDYSDGDMIYSETMDDWRTHNGIDISGNIGDNAIAVQDGEVTEVTSDEIWGEVIVIQHGNGLKAKYCGVKATVKNGEKVEQGQVIGTVVAIPVEEKDGVHVHLETEVDGKTVDPIKALNLLGEAIENQQAE